MNKFKSLSAIAVCAVIFITALALPIAVSAASEDAYAEWLILGDNKYFIDLDQALLYKSYAQSSGLTITPGYSSTGTSFSADRFKLSSVSAFDSLLGTHYSTISDKDYYGLALTSDTEVTIDTKFSDISDKYLNYYIRIVWVNHNGEKGLDSGVKLTVGETSNNLTMGNSSSPKFQVYDLEDGYTADKFTISRYNSDCRLCYIGIKYNAMPIEFGESSTDSGYY